MERLIVATAGHVDHGKTSLVRALTGVELDALPEEQQRGITIDLGFVPWPLATGRVVSVIDCPGHEKFVRTMVAGAHGVDGVLLCVSAVDGIMPQTREHLAILDLLGVEQAVLVLTMADLVDEELLELAAEELLELVEGTSLEGSPVQAISSVNESGLADLASLVGGFVPTAREESGDFRLPVDRVFVADGFGLVATGTVIDGQVQVGDQLALSGAGVSVRVRGLQVHGEGADLARIGQRVALNVVGADRTQLGRGTVVFGGPPSETQMMDVMLRCVQSDVPMEDGMQVRLLQGSASVLGRVHLIGHDAQEAAALGEGEHGFAQIRLEAPLWVVPGDRFVVRRVSPETTLGGGVVLDPWAARFRTKHRGRCREELVRLSEGDSMVWLERAGDLGLEAGAWRVRRSYGPRLGPAVNDRAVMLAGTCLAPGVVERFERVIVAELRAFHGREPLALGMPARSIHGAALGHVSERVFDAIVARIVDAGRVSRTGALLADADFDVRLTDEQHAEARSIEQTVEKAGLVGLSPKELHELHTGPATLALVHWLEHEQRVARVAGVGWVHRSVLDDLAARLMSYFEGEHVLSPVAFKDVTGLTRKTAIPWLEWTDQERWTKRTSEGRTRGDALRRPRDG